MARKFTTGGISTCFHCGKQLVRIKGGFIFGHIVDPDGHIIRVHKDCLDQAVGHGYKRAAVQP